MSTLRYFLGMVVDSFRIKRLLRKRRRAERALRRRGLCIVVDFELGRVVPSAASTFSSFTLADKIATQLSSKTNRVHVVATIVKGVPMELFDELAFGADQDTSPGFI
jgi:hypothetical protein